MQTRIQPSIAHWIITPIDSQLLCLDAECKELLQVKSEKGKVKSEKGKGKSEKGKVKREKGKVKREK